MMHNTQMGLNVLGMVHITGTRNSHSSADEIHEVVECHSLRRFSVNICYGILGDMIIQDPNKVT
jgi:hypothetical protein